MRLVLIVLSFLGAAAAAEPGDIQCFAHQYETADNRLVNEVKEPLKLESKNGSLVVFSVDIGERHYGVNGDTSSGDFMLTQTWGQDYMHGVVTTGSFNSSGRLQVTLVEKSKVYKLVCTKILASSFPKE